MLALLVFLPIAAFIAILLGAPARLTAIGASAVNLVLGICAAFSWHNTGLWSCSASVLEKPALHLAFGITDGMSAVMVLLSVIVTLAAVLSGKSPQGREKLYYRLVAPDFRRGTGCLRRHRLVFLLRLPRTGADSDIPDDRHAGRGDRREAAWKITIYLGLGSIVLLAGLVWLANLTGTYDMVEMSDRCRHH